MIYDICAKKTLVPPSIAGLLPWHRQRFPPSNCLTAPLRRTADHRRQPRSNDVCILDTFATHVSVQLNHFGSWMILVSFLNLGCSWFRFGGLGQRKLVSVPHNLGLVTSKVRDLRNTAAKKERNKQRNVLSKKQIIWLGPTHAHVFLKKVAQTHKHKHSKQGHWSEGIKARRCLHRTYLQTEWSQTLAETPGPIPRCKQVAFENHTSKQGVLQRTSFHKLQHQSATFQCFKQLK